MPKKAWKADKNKETILKRIIFIKTEKKDIYMENIYITVSNLF